MKVAYIAGPYSADTLADIQHNIQMARAYAKKYWRLGYAVICPQANTAHMDDVVSYHQFCQGYIELVSRCDVIVMIPGWENSIGAKKELYEATCLGKEIVYERPLSIGG